MSYSGYASRLMRIWSIHPKYLDTKGLVALWRETLLAQKVLQGKTKGYTQHPQLIRFKQQQKPLEMIGSYLHVIHLEASERGYAFDKSKILKQLPKGSRIKISVTTGQIEYEIKHLKNKLKVRAPKDLSKFKSLKTLELHPLFRAKPGDIEPWEII